MIHEDERRILEDWPEAKIITAKKDCELGNHYHKIKTERFVLSCGAAIMRVGHLTLAMDEGQLYTVHPNEMHSFKLSAGSVLIGLCSHPYDPSDDYTI